MILERKESLSLISVLFWLHIEKSASLPRRSNSVTKNVESSIRTEAPSGKAGVPPEAYMSTPELVSRNGFPIETHKVYTLDGYVLTVFRIPHGRNNETGKGPLMLAHCFLCSSSDWLLLVPHSDDCLPYVLANQGYDVWMINFRGNEYSQEHVNLSIDTFEFWNFSAHEMGLYDTPAAIEYVLSESGSSKLSYVGHSMGTTAFFIAMDRHPSLQEKVEKMVALAPAAYLSHTRSPARYFAPASSWFFWITKTLNHGRILSPLLLQILHSKVPKLCEYTPFVCSNVAFLIIGYDPREPTPETLAVLAEHTPAESSGKALSHFLQWMARPRFQEYDYGESENLVHYNQTEPPLYKLKVNKVPTFVLYGLNDLVIAKEDLDRTVRELGNAVRVQAVQDPQWNHLDFLYGKDAKSLVYSHILNFLALVMQETETIKD